MVLALQHIYRCTHQAVRENFDSRNMPARGLLEEFLEEDKFATVTFSNKRICPKSPVRRGKLYHVVLTQSIATNSIGDLPLIEEKRPLDNINTVSTV